VTTLEQLEQCKCSVSFHNVAQEGAPRWNATLHSEACPVHGSRDPKQRKVMKWNKWQKHQRLLEQYCECEYVAIRSGTTVSEEDITMELNGQGWKLVKVFDLCPLHGSDPRHDLPEGI